MWTRFARAECAGLEAAVAMAYRGHVDGAPRRHQRRRRDEEAPPGEPEGGVVGYLHVNSPQAAWNAAAAPHDQEASAILLDASQKGFVSLEVKKEDRGQRRSALITVPLNRTIAPGWGVM